MCKAAGNQNPYQCVCGHPAIVGWPLSVEAAMEWFFGMAEVPVVGQEKHRVTFSLDLNATGARGSLAGCHITDLPPCTQRLLQRNYKEQLLRPTELKHSDTNQKSMGSEMKSASGEMLYNIPTSSLICKKN